MILGGMLISPISCPKPKTKQNSENLKARFGLSVLGILVLLFFFASVNNSENLKARVGLSVLGILVLLFFC